MASERTKVLSMNYSPSDAVVIKNLVKVRERERDGGKEGGSCTISVFNAILLQ